jgi:hypothetical protein
MKHTYNYLRLLLVLLLGLPVDNYVIAQCTTPVITSISNSGPVCVGSTLTLHAAGTVGGLTSGYVRMLGVGGNFGNREFDFVFSSGDRAGSISRISNAAFDGLFASQTTDSARAAVLRASYDVIMFTWASPYDGNITYGLISAYLKQGGSVFMDGDYANVGNLSPTIIGAENEGSSGCSYILNSPAPFPTLIANGINGCFVNNHLSISSWPSWMHPYIMASDNSTTMAVAGIYPSGLQGRLIIQGPDQDFHAVRGGADPGGNQYKMLLNQLDFLSANQAGFTWAGPNGFTSNDVNPVISNVTSAAAGTYTATLTNVTGGGCSTTATTTVTINSLPSAGTISGNNSVFAGYTTALSETVSGGTWTSSNTSIATVNAGTGVVTGVAGGAATITYTATNSSGCSSYTTYGITVLTCSSNAILTFNTTGAPQTWTVPAGVSSVQVTVIGGAGGAGYYDASYSNHPGRGGKVTATLAVTPGQVLNLYVGGKGGNFTSTSAFAPGGYNGGGSGDVYGYYGGGGGGASDIRVGGAALSNRVIVAGGGGGNGLTFTTGQNGGDGGGTTGGAGGSQYADGGGGGTQTAGGAGGNYSSLGGNYAGAAGTSGNGGNGAYYYAGGGGGGYYGGGGGGYYGHGGGGSSYANSTLASSVAHTQGYNTSNGQIVIAFPQSNVVISSQPSGTTVCAGGNATFSVTASMAVAPTTLSYQWQVNTGSGWSSISGATNTSYTVTAASTDNGKQYHCVVSGVCGQSTTSSAATLTVANPTVTATATDVSCYGGSNGAVSTSVSDGIAAYSWNTGAATASISGLTSGTYNVTVTDGYGCTASASATVNQPTALTASSSNTAILCNGGTSIVTVSAAGGTTPYSGDGAQTPVYAGTYSYTVTDANGCTATTSGSISEPEALSITATASNTSCNTANGGTHNDGSISTSVTGGTAAYSYAWSGGATGANPSGLIIGTYSVTVTDANGCTATGSATVGEPTALTLSWNSPRTDATHMPTCTNIILFGYDASISVTASGGTPSYSGETYTIPSGFSSSYTVTVTDANGCTASKTACAVDVTCSAGSSGAHKIEMCHNGHSICVDTNAISAQLATGSTVGACGSWKHSNNGNSVDPSDAIRVYPNPTEGMFNVEIPVTYKNALVMVTDITGRVVAQKTITDNAGTPVQVTPGNLVPGIYLVKITTGDNTTIVKLSVQ